MASHAGGRVGSEQKVQRIERTDVPDTRAPLKPNKTRIVGLVGLSRNDNADVVDLITLVAGGVFVLESRPCVSLSAERRQELNRIPLFFFDCVTCARVAEERVHRTRETLRVPPIIVVVRTICSTNERLMNDCASLLCCSRTYPCEHAATAFVMRFNVTHTFMLASSYTSSRLLALHFHSLEIPSSWCSKEQNSATEARAFALLPLAFFTTVVAVLPPDIFRLLPMQFTYVVGRTHAFWHYVRAYLRSSRTHGRTATHAPPTDLRTHARSLARLLTHSSPTLPLVLSLLFSLVLCLNTHTHTHASQHSGSGATPETFANFSTCHIQHAGLAARTVFERFVHARTLEHTSCNTCLFCSCPLAPVR